LQKEKFEIILLAIHLYSAFANRELLTSTPLTLEEFHLRRSLTNISQRIFIAMANSGDFITLYLQKCATGTDCRDSPISYLACRCYSWW